MQHQHTSFLLSLAGVPNGYMAVSYLSSLPSMTKRTHDHARPPRPTSSTTETRHVYIENTTARALLEPSLLFGPCQIGISPEYAPYQKPRPRSGFDNADIGPSLSHVSLYHTKLLSRTYLYDFVCDVTRFTHLVTSQSHYYYLVENAGTRLL